MKIIAITGMPGSGKTEALNILRNLGWVVFEMGDVVREEVVRRGVERNAKNSETVAVDLRKQFGKDVLAERTWKKIEDSKKDKIVVSGFRNIEEIDFFKTKAEVKTAVVNAPTQIRFERLAKRGREGDPKTFEEFKWRDDKEKSRGLGYLLEHADFVIDNTGTFEELADNIKKMLTDIGEI